jgi:hypothetical protein
LERQACGWLMRSYGNGRKTADPGVVLANSACEAP